jgi:hypothetical protein
MTAVSQLIEQENFMPAQAERKYGLSQWIWRRLAYSGRVASIKVGPRLLIPRSECERILSENTRPRKVNDVPSAKEAPGNPPSNPHSLVPLQRSAPATATGRSAPRPNAAQTGTEDFAPPGPLNRLNRFKRSRAHP